MKYNKYLIHQPHRSIKVVDQKNNKKKHLKMNTNKRIHKIVVKQAKSPTLPNKKQSPRGNFNITNNNIYPHSLKRR